MIAWRRSGTTSRGSCRRRSTFYLGALWRPAHWCLISARTVKANRVSNVDIVHALISDKTGMDFASLSFNSSKAFPDRDGHDGEPVESLTVDDLSHAFGWPQVVYMDIEGFEIGALKGA